MAAAINAAGVVFAKNKKISTKIVNYKNIQRAERQIINHLNIKKIKLICLAGFMKILSEKFVQKFKHKIINIHPSLLPKYKGLNTHQRVIDSNEKFSGCTVHFVNSKLDSGKIILQKKVRVFKNDNSELLAKRILKKEHILYPEAIMKVFTNL